MLVKTVPSSSITIDVSNKRPVGLLRSARLLPRALAYGLVVGLLSSLPAHALDQAQAAELLSALFKVRSNGNLVMNSYYNFSIAPGDKDERLLVSERAEALASSTGRINEMATTLEEGQLREQLLRIPEIQGQYAALLKDNIADLIERQYSDIRLVADMAQVNQNLLTAAETAKRSAMDAASYQPDVMVEQLREATLLMESMMTKYSARSASTVSQVFQGAQTDEPIDVQAVNFDKQLNAIKAALGNNAEATKALKSIESSWFFIKGSYINYNENNVSYVVNLYSNKIVEKLNGLLESLSKTS
ncbi:hypothetical protein [Allohahella marinimesophila]|uniref:PilJ/NarX-like methyl-accepting chemotaxis transducer n=1 Tax=Allohahella marinimesophila TaxID=1054972 RepID=A0ABP7QB24_9GAMM